MGKGSLTVDELVEIAKEVEAEDPIDWGLLSVDEESAYRLMAMHVLEMFSDNDQATTMATIVKLLVENFMLNLKLELINNENP
jgi:hypothetical protein